MDWPFVTTYLFSEILKQAYRIGLLSVSVCVSPVSLLSKDSVCQATARSTRSRGNEYTFNNRSFFFSFKSAICTSTFSSDINITVNKSKYVHTWKNGLRFLVGARMLFSSKAYRPVCGAHNLLPNSFMG
jgi:hypothetical protein